MGKLLDQYIYHRKTFRPVYLPWESPGNYIFENSG